MKKTTENPGLCRRAEKRIGVGEVGGGSKGWLVNNGLIMVNNGY